MKTALLGMGTVGGGVAELLDKNSDKIAQSARESVELKYILDVRPHPESPYADKIVTDFSIIENDPEIGVVAECIGGIGAAYNFVKRALCAGKSVVTSNKELVAEKGLELLSIAKEKKVSFLFEASVGGGIPIIRPLTQCLAANKVQEIYGILNGTTNYILTQMLQCSQSFDEALKDAQCLGYAEADPTADIDGIDACRKICILADLCFGKNVSPALVKSRGIRGVTAQDASAAEELGFAIKLLGRAVRTGQGAAVYVAPHLIAQDKMLANVSGVMNGIVVRGDAVGECLFYGAGAGRFPTASAVVADMMDAVRHDKEKKYITWGPEEQTLTDADELPRRWYVRAAEDLPALGRGVKLPEGEQAVITQVMPLSELTAALGDVEALSLFPVLD